MLEGTSNGMSIRLQDDQLSGKARLRYKLTADGVVNGNLGFMQGMSLVPAVTELMLAELLYLQYDSPTKPVFMYVNSTGVTVRTHPPCLTNLGRAHHFEGTFVQSKSLLSCTTQGPYGLLAFWPFLGLLTISKIARQEMTWPHPNPTLVCMYVHLH